MALSAAFSIARIIIGVASTGGSNASLNRFAKCSGATTRLKLPFAPTGISDMPDLLMPRLTPARMIRRDGWLDGGSTNRESGEAWRSTYANAEQMELIGVIKRWTRCA